MEQNTVGKMIRYYRNRLGLSQEIICKGICSVATLSRIEWEEISFGSAKFKQVQKAD